MAGLRRRLEKLLRKVSRNRAESRTSRVAETVDSATTSAEILAVLDQLAGLDSVGKSRRAERFTHTFQHWLERSTAGEDRRNRDGVTVLNATAARGLSFRALFYWE